MKPNYNSTRNDEISEYEYQNGNSTTYQSMLQALWGMDSKVVYSGDTGNAMMPFDFDAKFTVQCPSGYQLYVQVDAQNVQYPIEVYIKQLSNNYISLVNRIQWSEYTRVINSGLFEYAFPFSTFVDIKQINLNELTRAGTFQVMSASSTVDKYAQDLRILPPIQFNSNSYLQNVSVQQDAQIATLVASSSENQITNRLSALGNYYESYCFDLVVGTPSTTFSIDRTNFPQLFQKVGVGSLVAFEVAYSLGTAAPVRGEVAISQILFPTTIPVGFAQVAADFTGRSWPYYREFIFDWRDDILRIDVTSSGQAIAWWVKVRILNPTNTIGGQNYPLAIFETINSIQSIQVRSHYTLVPTINAMDVFLNSIKQATLKEREMAKVLMQFLKQSQMPLCFSEESGKHIFNFLMQSDPGVMRASLMGDIVRGLKGIPKFINDNRDQLFRIGAMALSGNWPGVVAESLGLLQEQIKKNNIDNTGTLRACFKCDLLPLTQQPEVVIQQLVKNLEMGDVSSKQVAQQIQQTQCEEFGTKKEQYQQQNLETPDVQLDINRKLNKYVMKMSRYWLEQYLKKQSSVDAVISGLVKKTQSRIESTTQYMLDEDVILQHDDMARMIQLVDPNHKNTYIDQFNKTVYLQGQQYVRLSQDDYFLFSAQERKASILRRAPIQQVYQQSSVLLIDMITDTYIINSLDRIFTIYQKDQDMVLLQRQVYILVDNFSEQAYVKMLGGMDRVKPELGKRAIFMNLVNRIQGTEKKPDQEQIYNYDKSDYTQECIKRVGKCDYSLKPVTIGMQYQPPQTQAYYYFPVLDEKNKGHLLAMTITEGKPIKEFKSGWTDMFAKSADEFVDLYRFKIPLQLMTSTVSLDAIKSGKYKEQSELWTFQLTQRLEFEYGPQKGFNMNVWARNDVWFTVQIWVPSGLVANKVADLSWTAILWCFLVGAVPGAVITGGPSDSDFMTQGTWEDMDPIVMEEKWAAYKRAWIELPVNSCFIWCTNSDNDDLLTKMLIDDRQKVRIQGLSTNQFAPYNVLWFRTTGEMCQQSMVSTVSNAFYEDVITPIQDPDQTKFGNLVKKQQEIGFLSRPDLSYNCGQGGILLRAMLSKANTSGGLLSLMENNVAVNQQVFGAYKEMMRQTAKYFAQTSWNGFMLSGFQAQGELIAEEWKRTVWASVSAIQQNLMQTKFDAYNKASEVARGKYPQLLLRIQDIFNVCLQNVAYSKLYWQTKLKEVKNHIIKRLNQVNFQRVQNSPGYKVFYVGDQGPFNGVQYIKYIITIQNQDVMKLIGVTNDKQILELVQTANALLESIKQSVRWNPAESLYELIGKNQTINAPNGQQVVEEENPDVVYEDDDDQGQGMIVQEKPSSSRLRSNVQRGSNVGNVILGKVPNQQDEATYLKE